MKPRPEFSLREISPLWLVPLAIVVGAVLATIYGRGALFLTLAGFTLLGTIWVFSRSLQSLTGDAPLSLEEALGLGAPSAEEERKTAVLRALKDLEYERAVGKIEEADFAMLSTKYRAEARALLQLLDDDLKPARARVEAELAERLAREPGVEPGTKPPRPDSGSEQRESADTSEKSEKSEEERDARDPQ